MKICLIWLMTIPFVLIIALSVVSSQNISAIKGQTGNILNSGSTVASVCKDLLQAYLLRLGNLY
jgi:hypothetical protein